MLASSCELRCWVCVRDNGIVSAAAAVADRLNGSEIEATLPKATKDKVLDESCVLKSSWEDLL
jgi:hypothetical protein